MKLEDFYRISAEHYDADYRARGHVEDISLYVELAQASGGPVLEMGCGTGRITIPIARAGVAIHGMDMSEDMLEQLQRSLSHEPQVVQDAVRITRGDVRSTRAPGDFALVIAPFRVAQHLLTRDDQKAWLRNVKRHLRAGGELVFDVFNPDFTRMTGSRSHIDLEREVPGGRMLRRHAEFEARFETQLLDIRLTWAIEDGSRQRIYERKAEFQLRWYLRAELENLLELEGFEVLDYWGGFKREPFGAGSSEQVVRAKVKSY
jgi:SAM-dependent methyltransferase